MLNAFFYAVKEVGGKRTPRYAILWIFVERINLVETLECFRSI